MSYELIALDLDGTLTNSERKITPQTREAIIDIQKAGKKVIIASGRPDTGVLPIIEELELDKYGSFALTYNGARIRNCKTGEIIYDQPFPAEYIAPIYEIVKEYPGIDCFCSTPEIYLSGIKVNEYTKLECKIINMDVTPVEDLVSAITFPINVLIAAGDPEALIPVEERLKKEYGHVLNIFRSAPFFLEMVSPEINKALTLQKLLDHLQMYASQMIACGDSFNDLPMIELAGLGVAMENGEQAVKDAADFVTYSNDEDGVLHVINKFMR